MNKATLNLLDRYRKEAWSIADSTTDPIENAKAKHVAWMCLEIPKTTDHKKHNRWIGFIQGYFWERDVFSIGEMRAHNIKCKL